MPPLRGGACNLRPWGPLRFFLLPSLKDVSFRRCAAAGLSSYFSFAPRRRGGLLFARAKRSKRSLRKLRFL